MNAESNPNLPAKKARQVIKIEDLKTTKVRIGSATITKCEVVPEERDVKAIAVKIECNAPNTFWWQQLENIRKMRAESPAPVDTLGCHQCADINADAKVKDPFLNLKLQVLFLHLFCRHNDSTSSWPSCSQARLKMKPLLRP